MYPTIRDLMADLPAELEAASRGAVESVRPTALTHDSREVTPGCLFAALRGLKVDGHDYIARALGAGATAVLLDDPAFFDVIDVPVIRVTNSRRALPYLAAAFHGSPGARLGLTGVTGTNGKTTVTYMIASILRAAGRRTGVIGTVGVHLDDEPVETHWSMSTTPESTELQELLANLLHRGADEVVMEVSSHAIDQERTACCPFDVAVFTNLTQDHLDYHVTMEAYSEAKRRLFTEYATKYAKPGFTSVLNSDDPTGIGYAESCVSLGVPTYLYSANGAEVDVSAANISASVRSITFDAVERGGASYKVTLPLGGLFNVQNALAAIGATRSRGIAIDEIQRGLSNIHGVPGRFEQVATGSLGFDVIVDYAHTPDGLENLLKSARALQPTRLLCVFGCGGNRDRAKRPLMGRIAASMADRVIVTSDNPRNEDPEAIVAEILGGIDINERGARVTSENDRRKAIHLAVREAKPGDLVVIAGKGHETYQIVGSATLPFDDRKIAAEEIAACK